MDATTFPLPLPYHVGLCVIGCIFFLIQFIRMKKPYQLIMAIAMPASLLIYIKPDDTTLFYMIGLFEGFAILAAILMSLILRIVNRKSKQQEEQPQ